MTGKKALLLISSPRKRSNSTVLGNAVASGFTEAGGLTETVNLAKLDIRPCRACEFCKSGAKLYCTIDDDMEALYPRLLETDALILASPIYWFHISAQLKLFVDRWYALEGRKEHSDQNLLKGKHFALAFTFGDDDPVVSGAVNAYRSFQDAFSYIGAELAGAVYAGVEEAGGLGDDAEVLDTAKELGGKLFSIS